jgi:hypothetical protein
MDIKTLEKARILEKEINQIKARIKVADQYTQGTTFDGMNLTFNHHPDLIGYAVFCLDLKQTERIFLLALDGEKENLKKKLNHFVNLMPPDDTQPDDLTFNDIEKDHFHPITTFENTREDYKGIKDSKNA